MLLVCKLVIIGGSAPSIGHSDIGCGYLLSTIKEYSIHVHAVRSIDVILGNECLL